MIIKYKSISFYNTHFTPYSLLIILLFILYTSITTAQNGVGINTTSPQAALDVTSTSSGILIPRMTSAQRVAISSPPTASLVYQTDGVTGFYYYNGSTWLPLLNNTTGWNTTGNAGTTAGTNFIGTTDAQDFAINTNGTEKVRVLTNGNVGIGTTLPLAKLHIVNDQDGAFGNGSSIIVDNPDANANGGASAIRLYRSGSTKWALVNDVDGNATDDLTIWGAGALKAITVKATTGNVGIGTTTPGAALDLLGTGGNVNMYVRSSTLTTANPIGMHIDNSLPATATNSYNGIIVHPTISNNINVVNGFNVENPTNGSGTITTFNGFYASDQTHGTNIYGFRGIISSGTNKYNLYLDGTAQNHMAGNLGIGTTTPAYKLDVNTGGIRNNGVIHTGSGGIRQHVGVVQFSDCSGAPTTFLIQTNLVFNGSVTHMPTLRIWGTGYTKGVIDLKLTWHLFTGAVWPGSYSYINNGTWTPTQIRLANVGGFVAIEIEDNTGIYCPKFTVDAYDYAPDTEYDGWTMSVGSLPGSATGIVVVPQSSIGAVNNSAWLQNGNSNSALKSLGTNNNYDLPFTTNSTERMRITATGNVGIGTTTPSALFHVNGIMRWGGGSTAPYIYSSVDGGGSYLEQVGTSTANSRLRLQSSPSGSTSTYAQFFIDPVNGFSFVSGAGGNSGNVGIGTTTPSFPLDVLGGSFDGNNTNSNVMVRGGPQLTAPGQVTYSSIALGPIALTAAKITSINSWNDGGYLLFSTTSAWGTVSERMRILPSGNVGINTTNPLSKLHINGTQLSAFTGASRGMISIEGAYTNGYYAPIDFLYTNSANPTARIAAQSNSFGSKLMFGTSNNYAAGITNTAMTIDHSGNVGISTTAPQKTLDVNGVFGVDAPNKTTQITEHFSMFSGYVSGPDGWPACTTPAKIVTLGTIASGSYGSIEIEVYGTHRGYTNTDYTEYKKYIVMVGDYVSAVQVSAAGTRNVVNLWDGSTAALYNNIAIGGGFDIRLQFSPVCGAGFQYYYTVKYASPNFTPNATRSW